MTGLSDVIASATATLTSRAVLGEGHSETAVQPGCAPAKTENNITRHSQPVSRHPSSHYITGRLETKSTHHVHLDYLLRKSETRDLERKG